MHACTQVYAEGLTRTNPVVLGTASQVRAVHGADSCQTASTVPAYILTTTHVYIDVCNTSA